MICNDYIPRICRGCEKDCDSTPFDCMREEDNAFADKMYEERRDESRPPNKILSFSTSTPVSSTLPRLGFLLRNI